MVTGAIVSPEADHVSQLILHVIHLCSGVHVCILIQNLYRLIETVGINFLKTCLSHFVNASLNDSAFNTGHI